MLQEPLFLLSGPVPDLRGGLMHVDVPACHDPVAQVTVEATLEVGQLLPRPPMIRCSNGSRRSSLNAVSATRSKWWCVCSTNLHVFQLVIRVGESHAARDLVDDVLHLLDLPEVIEEEARLVLVGQADGIAVGLFQDLLQGPQDEPVLEERPLAEGPGQPQPRA